MTKLKAKKTSFVPALLLIGLLVVLLLLDNLSFVPAMLLTVLRKGAEGVEEIPLEEDV